MRRVIFVFALMIATFPVFAQTKYIAVYPKNVPPYYIYENGETKGFAIDLIKKLASITGLDIELVAVDNRREALHMVQNGKAQIIPNTIKTVHRSEYLLFTEPFEMTEVSVITRKDRRDINTIPDLAGHRVAYQKENIHTAKLSQVMDVEYLSYNSANEMIFNLLTGHVDAIIFHKRPTMELAKEMGLDGRLKVIIPPLYHSMRAMGISKDAPELYNILNTALVNFMHTAEYDQIYAKWHMQESQQWDRETTYTFFFLMLLGTTTLLVTWRIFSMRKKNRELEKAKHALESSEKKFRALAKISNDVMIFASADFEKIYCASEAYTRLTGQDPEKLAGTPHTFTRCIHPDDRHKLLQGSIQMRPEMNNEKVRVINSATGATSWVIIRDYSFNDEHTGEEMLAVVITDITDVVRAQDEQAAQEAVMVQQAKYASMGEMIRAVTHQWSQPLNALSICNLIMQDMVETGKYHDMRECINNSTNLVEHMSSTIEDFRTFFKADETSELFDATETVIRTIKLVEPQIKSLDIKYSFHCKCDQNEICSMNTLNTKDHACRFRIKGKKNEFKHAVLNIIQNAKDELTKLESKDKTIDISVTYGDELTLRITDNGRGISENMLEKIFMPDITMKKNGTGLGLHLTRRIIDSMKGSVWAENMDTGARFTIKIPLTNNLEASYSTNG